MVIDVSVQYNERWIFPRHYIVDPMFLPSGNPFKCHEDVLKEKSLSLQPMIYDPT